MLKAIFSFDRYELNGNVAEFFYSYKHDGIATVYQEKVQFPDQFLIQDINQKVLETLMMNLHLVLGVSYWKLDVAPTVVHPYDLTDSAVSFWKALYRSGLGEFFFVNKIDPKVSPNFDSTASKRPKSTNLETRDDQVLLGFSGGKDSLASLSLLANSDFHVQPFIIQTNQNQGKVIETLEAVSSYQPLIVERTLDDALLANPKNKGHVPISAIIAFVAMVLAAGMKTKYVVVGNERSSSEPNTTYKGLSINHQWSKSLEFEKMLQEYSLESFDSSLCYFSLLRPLSELKIVEIISTKHKFLENFVSCNKNFVIDADNTKRWCGECAKCASTFALLSAFVPKSTLIKMYKKNMYSDVSLAKLYKALLGIEGIKPFDCVGSVEEIQTAFWKAHLGREYQNDPIMHLFEQESLPNLKNTSDVYNSLMSPAHIDQLPSKFQAIVRNI